MTQEQKELLLKDLCARLPYHVVLHFNDELKQYDEYLYGFRENGGRFMINDAYYIEEVKPYLRPMSSMTEEEDKEICQFMKDYNLLPGSNKAGVFCGEIVDWLNAHHFDYRGLIPKGLAIEVTENNNPYKD